MVNCVEGVLLGRVLCWDARCRLSEELLRLTTVVAFNSFRRIFQFTGQLSLCVG